MDMQNVSNLQIPDGFVRTIHDKDNRLIWSMVNYDTKYAGNTVQDGTPTPDAPTPVQVVTGAQTVTISDGDTSQAYPISLIGKNLFDKTAGGIRNGYLRSDGTISGTEWRITDYIPIKPNTTYTTSGMASGAGSNPSRCYYDENKTYISGKTHGFNNPFIDTSPAGAYYMRDSFQSGDLDTLQVEESSQASTYAPYYNYELCKIGDYQDYIYKSGDDWYVHKAIGKITYTGDSSENWQYSSTSPGPFRIAIPNAKYYTSNNVAPLVYCDYYTPAIWSSITPYNYAVTAFNNNVLPFRNKDITSLDAWKTWLSSHNTTVYYPFATPADTKITDNTLISQLDAIHQFLARYGYNATVTGNLPIIISKTNL